jgi:probable rRNA maturation factor
VDMNFQIEIQNPDEYLVDTARLQEASIAVLESHEVEADSGLTVVIASDDFVRGLNRQYRGIDAATDVLSFPAGEPDIEDESPYLGDLIIAYPYASSQAAHLGHNLDDSLALLVVHGTLHLLGYDHDNSESRAQMWMAQEIALRELGIPLHIVPALEESSHDDPA